VAWTKRCGCNHTSNPGNGRVSYCTRTRRGLRVSPPVPWPAPAGLCWCACSRRRGLVGSLLRACAGLWGCGLVLGTGGPMRGQSMLVGGAGGARWRPDARSAGVVLSAASVDRGRVSLRALTMAVAGVWVAAVLLGRSRRGGRGRRGSRARRERMRRGRRRRRRVLCLVGQGDPDGPVGLLECVGQ
jgi:hypothetical protein